MRRLRLSRSIAANPPERSALRVTRYIRQHHIGLIALFIALTGTAYAGTQVAGHPSDLQAATAKKKKAKRGPAGPQGPKGDSGQPGSPAASVNTGFVDRADGFGAPSGVSTASLTESAVQTLTPAGASFTARDLSVSASASIGGSQTLTTTLRVNGADTALSCTVPGGGSTCQDSSHAVTIPPNSRISLSLAEPGSGSCCVALAFGWRAVP